MYSAATLEGLSLLSDEAIVSQVLDGHAAMFEVLMRRHNERLFRAARAILKDAGEAEDVMQQAYVNAYAHLSQFDRRASFATWLTRIAVNEALARARTRGRYQSIEDGDAIEELPLPSGEDPERQAFTHEMSGILERAIDALPDGWREVIMLREVQGLSTAETAECLGVTEDVVKSRLSRARATLRGDLLDRVGAAVVRSFTFLRPRCDRVVQSVLARIRPG
jgi:RNA polymerase sigma-70 factor (ECF subfamily)